MSDISANNLITIIINNVFSNIKIIVSNNQKGDLTKLVENQITKILPELIDKSINEINDESKPDHPYFNAIINSILHQLALYVTKNKNYSIPKKELEIMIKNELSKKLPEIIPLYKSAVTSSTTTTVNENDIVLSDSDDLVLDD